MSHPGPGLVLIREELARRPNIPHATLARELYARAPELWPSARSCRDMVRYATGNMGKKNRANTARKELMRAPRQAGEDWMKYLPQPKRHFEDWGPVQFDGPLKVLNLSDIHIPYHDPDALGVALDYGLERDADMLLLNGDTFDFFGLSHWEKDPRERDFPGEVREGREFLRLMRKMFPKARIVLKEGNHEERYDRYFRLKAPEVLGIEDFEWRVIYQLARHGIEFVGDKRPIRLGELNVLHGHEYRFNISNPVNPARGFFLRAKTHVLGGHLHQTSQHSEKDLEGKTVSAWSTGCLCDLHPDYRPLNPWNHGFAFIEVYKGGAFRVENLRIIDGRAW